MLFKTSQESIKTAVEYLMKLPFSKHLLHKVSEIARGKSIAYFTLHRILEDTPNDFAHPHFLNKTAITIKQAHRLLTYLNHRLPFVSLNDSLEFLKGQKTMNQSMAVLLIEVPYMKTIRLIKPLLEELKIPATIILNTESLYDGQMPWMDEIVYRVGSTTKKELSVNFIDRSFSLNSVNERMSAASHLIEYISHTTESTLRARVKQLRDTLSEVAVHPISERICTIDQLDKIALDPLFTFASAGKYRLPFFDIALEDAKVEIVDAMNDLRSLLNQSLAPVFFYPLGSDKRRHIEIIKLMLDNGLQAAISRTFGVCRPGDNMFRLRRLPLMQGSKSFEQFELQGLFDAIDEILLVTLAKEKGL